MRARPMSQTALILHPAVQFYRQAIEQLQQQLRDVLFCWYQLVVEERPRLLNRYAELFGELERTMQVETLKAAQVQRVCEIVHMYVRRGETITDDLLRRICQLVERQHRHYRQQTETAGHAQPATSQAATRFPERARLCAQLYRDLVKRLHPDRDGDAGLFERFWGIVQDAYSRGDLDRLRTVHGIVCIDAQYRTDKAETVELLAVLHRRLLYRLEYELRRIDRIRAQEPFTLAPYLESDEWIAQHRAELERKIELQRRAAHLAAEELHRYGAAVWEEHFRAATAESVPDDVFQDEFIKNTYFSMRS